MLFEEKRLMGWKEIVKSPPYLQIKKEHRVKKKSMGDLEI